MSPAVVTLIILALAVVLFVFEVFPAEYTAMGILILLILTGVLTPQEAFAGFTDSSILLIAAMFIVGDALFITGVADHIGAGIVKYAKSERMAVILIMLTLGLASGFLSNTGSAAIFIPITLSVIKSGGYNKNRMLMPIAIAATIGGTLTLLGTPPNIIVSSALTERGLEGFSVFDFTPFAMPLFIISILYYAFIGYRFIPEDGPKIEINQEIEETIEKGDQSRWRQVMAVVILILTVLGLIFSENFNIPFYVIAWVGAILLVFTNTITAEQATDSLDMSTILLLVGTLALGTALEKTGAGEMIANWVLSLAGDHPIMIIGAVMLITIILSNFMSNTATAALMAPIGLSIALELSASPQMMMMAIALGASSSYATPFGSTPNMMIYGIGSFRFMDFVKVGLPLVIINFIVAMVLMSLLLL